MRGDTTCTGHGKPQEPDFRTVTEAARYLRLCEKQVRRLISRGELRAYRFGTALRIKRNDLQLTPMPIVLILVSVNNRRRNSPMMLIPILDSIDDLYT